MFRRTVVRRKIADVQSLIRWGRAPTCTLDAIQDFLCKLGMKPHVHLVEISIFSLNHVIVRPTKIIKDNCKSST